MNSRRLMGTLPRKRTCSREVKHGRARYAMPLDKALPALAVRAADREGRSDPYT